MKISKEEADQAFRDLDPVTQPRADPLAEDCIAHSHALSRMMRESGRVDELSVASDPGPWTRVEDALPEAWARALVWSGDEVEVGELMGAGGGLNNYWLDADEEFIKGVTHWMPLPEGPK